MITDKLIGKWVIVRSYNEGVNFGKLVEADETGCVIRKAQRIYYHKPLDSNQAWYEGVANSGLSDDSKISSAVKSKIIVEKYSITECTKEAVSAIKSKVPHGS